jgi:UDPglucose 6-dehydrogenase
MKTAKIEKIERLSYTGTVHNLELSSLDEKNDDLFWVCNNIVVHNCFPKDINALIKLSKNLDVNPVVLQAAWEKNKEVRKDKDWERQLGRAVSKRS